MKYNLRVHGIEELLTIGFQLRIDRWEWLFDLLSEHCLLNESLPFTLSSLHPPQANPSEVNSPG
jgi:hypothetical protein